jgi:integrase
VQTVHLPERVVEDPVLEAIAALSAKVTALAPAPTPAVNITHLWASFELAERGRLRSWRDYAQRWRDHVGPYFGGMDAHAVGPTEVDLYRAVRREFVAIATVNREVALLRRLVNFGVRRGLVRKSLLHGPGMTRELIHHEDNVRTTVIEQQADTGITLADLLLEAGPQLRAYIVLVHHSGLRRAEAALLRRDRIRNGVAWVPSAETKGGRSGRIVPLSSEALAAVAELPAHGDLPVRVPPTQGAADPQGRVDAPLRAPGAQAGARRARRRAPMAARSAALLRDPGAA